MTIIIVVENWNDKQTVHLQLQTTVSRLLFYAKSTITVMSAEITKRRNKANKIVKDGRVSGDAAHQLIFLDTAHPLIFPDTAHPLIFLDTAHPLILILHTH